MTSVPMIYPFTAVVGQDETKLALLLCAVNPRIGGVLLSGEKGTAKSTVVRGLAELLPGRVMRTLALGTTEDLSRRWAGSGGHPGHRPSSAAARVAQ